MNLSSATGISIPAATNSPSAIKTDDGKTGWVVQVSGEALCTPAYGNGKIFLGGGFSSREFFAFNASTGQKAWQIPTLDNGPTSPAVDKNVVTYNTESCHIEAVAADTGTRLWSELIGMTLVTQTAIADGKVFSAHPFMDNRNNVRQFKMVCMDLKTGKHNWDADITGDVLGAPVIAHHMVYFACTDGTVFCLKTSTGGMEWQEKYMATAAPLIANGQVVLTVKDGNGNEGLMRFDALEGDAKETKPFNRMKADSHHLAKETQVAWDYQGPRPVLAKGHVITAQGNTLTSLNIDTGITDWALHFRNSLLSLSNTTLNSPAIGQGKIYLTTTEGNVLCINQSDGAVLFNYATGQKFTTQPILADGNIYLTTATGRLLCLNTNDKAADGWSAWGGNAQHNKSD